MTDTDTRHLSWDEWDELHRPAPVTTDFDRIVDQAMSRRGFIGSLVAFGSGAAAMGSGLLTASDAAAMSASRFGFAPIDIQTDFSVHVPEGYNWQVVAKWGQPLFSDAPAFDPATGGTSASAARTFGENADGMELFEIGGRQVIAVNHE